jgi:asparagine synthase (glutamine-hydrolysing)
MPSSLKAGGGRGKLILRRLAERWLPRTYLEKPKRGFLVPLKGWMAKELSGELDDLGRCKLFNVVEVAKLVKAQRKNAKDYSPGLWRLIVLNRWLKHWKPEYRS